MAHVEKDQCPECKGKMINSAPDGFMVCMNKSVCSWSSDYVLRMLPPIITPPNCDTFRKASLEISEDLD